MPLVSSAGQIDLPHQFANEFLLRAIEPLEGTCSARTIAAHKKNEVWAPTNDDVSQLDEPGATKTQTSKLSAQTSRV